MTPHPAEDEAADYVFDHLPVAAKAAFEQAMEADKALQLTVSDLTEAAAALIYTAPQSLPPKLEPVRNPKLSDVHESNLPDAADKLE